MTQGAGQGPAVRTATLRDFRVPPYAQAPVATYDTEQAYGAARTPGAEQAPGTEQALGGEQALGAEQAFGGEREPGGEQVPADEHVREAGQAHGVPQLPYGTEPAYGSEPPHATEPAYESTQSYGAEPAHGSAQPYGTTAPYDTTRHAAQQSYDTEPYDEGDEPEGYTPTQRDLPVISRDDRDGAGDTLRGPLPEFEDRQNGEGPGPLFVVGDVHGYLVELLDALHEQGLIDEEGHWAAGNARLWFLGDFTDRGPDGIGVIDLVMRLSAEAAAAGGYCKALMGNHELLLLGARRFGDTPVNSGAGTATFQAAWLLNGGQKHDMERLQDVHLQWMARLDAVALEDGHLLTHSDTTAYLDYGSNIEDVNDTVHSILTRNDADECWDVFRKLTKRFAFRDEGGSDAVRELLHAYGGERIVHGHSPIPYLLGEVTGEDSGDGEGSSGPVVEGPHVYADGLAIAMDGGVTMAGKLLVVQLPLGD